VKMFGGLARMFPRAPLWLSTGLLRVTGRRVVAWAFFLTKVCTCG